MNFVFLHGGRHGGWCWDAVIGALKTQLGPEQAQFLALDAPGCGKKRGWSCADMSFDDIASELHDDVKRADIAPSLLVGHSMAGLFLPAMVARAPSLYSGVIGVSCLVPLPGQSLTDVIGTGLRGSNPDQIGFAADRSDWVNFVRIAFCDNEWPAESVEWLARQTEKDNWPDAIWTAKVPRANTGDLVPTAYVHLKCDNAHPPDWQRKFAERIGAGDSVVEINAAHDAMISHPEELAAVLIRFGRAWT